MTREQRRHHRFKVKEGAVAGFLKKDVATYAEMGDIIDVSRSGLSFRYMLVPEDMDEVSSELEIFAYKGPLVYVDKIPCKMIYELSDSCEFKTEGEVKRCGVQFGELSKHQTYQLQFFIENYASSEADDDHISADNPGILIGSSGQRKSSSERLNKTEKAFDALENAFLQDRD